MDKYELPLAVADTARELSELTGYHRTSIINGVSGLEKGKLKKSHFRKVIVDDYQD